MSGLMQRLTEAYEEIEGGRIGTTGPGLLVLACAERGDSELEAQRLVGRIPVCAHETIGILVSRRPEGA